MVRWVLFSACVAGLAAAVQLPGLPESAQITPAPIPKNVFNAAKLSSADSSGSDDDYEGLYACQNAESIVDYCYDAYDFDSCLCCDGSDYDPSYLDDSAKSCASYIESAYPKSTSEASLYSALGDYCQTVDSGVCYSSATIATVPTTTMDIPDACYSVMDIAEGCAYTDDGVYEGYDEDSASCFCYTTRGTATSWAPDNWDDEASSCADWIATAEPEYYSSWEELATFCHSVGDIMTTTATGTKTHTASTSAQTGHSGSTSSATATGATAVTVTVAPSSTGTSAANTMNGGASAAFGLASIVAALFAYLV
ncbi:hypothetical protein LQW54_013354 [Pestalotiopsis sp. IQ-011]